MRLAVLLATLAACASPTPDPRWFAVDPASVQREGSLTATFYPPDVGNPMTTDVCDASDPAVPASLEVTTDPDHACEQQLPSCACVAANSGYCYVLRTDQETGQGTWMFDTVYSGWTETSTVTLHGSVLSETSSFSTGGSEGGGTWTYAGTGCTVKLVANAQ